MIEVFAPGPRRLYRIDSPNRDQGPEDLHLVAATPGAYRFEIATNGATPGTYKPKLRAVRTPTETDRSQAAGDRAFYEAKEIESDPARFWETVAKYERSIRFFQEAGDRFHEAYAYLRLARVQARTARNREALDLFSRAEKLFRDIGAVHFHILALNEKGLCAQVLGDFERGEAAFRSAIGLASRAGEIKDEAASHHNLGNLLQSQGRSWEALGHFREALALWRRQDGAEARMNEAETLTSLGWVYQSAGDWQRALDAHERALHLRNGLGDAGLRSISLTQIGSIWLSIDPRRALPYLKRARALQQGIPGTNEAATLTGLGLAYRRLGLYGQAQSAYRRALDLYTTPPDFGGQGILWTNLGMVSLELSQPAEARQRFEKGLRLARQTRNPMAEARAFLGLAAAESQRGNDILAQRRAEESLAIVESLRSAIPRTDLQTSYLAANESSYDLLIRILMDRHRRQPGGGFDLQALSRSEQSRARGLIDALRESRQAEETAPAAPPELLARRRSLLEEVGVIDGRRRRPDLAPAEVAAAEKALAEALDQLSEVEASIRRHRLGQAPQSPPPDSLEAHRALLEPDTLLLQYHLGDRRSYLWAISAAGVQSFELPDLQSLEPLLRSTYAELSGTAGPGGPEASRALQLSRILLGPLAGHLRGKRLLIAADGLQRSIPFAALPSPIGNHQPLLLENEVVSIPSLTVVAELRDRSTSRQPAPRTLKIWADPVFDASDERLARTPAPQERDENQDEFLTRLILSRDEAEAIARLLPAPRPPIALDFEASRDLVLTDNLSDYRILHFATHGILRTDHPELSSLVLSRFDPQGNPRNGYLRVPDLTGLRLRADLVVLSACETAFGQRATGAERIGLPEAFLAAGARRVLASLWHVEEESTAALMEHFYQHLIDGLPAPKALREAQLAIRAQPRWRAPRYWAGFVLLGDWK